MDLFLKLIPLYRYTGLSNCLSFPIISLSFPIVALSFCLSHYSSLYLLAFFRTLQLALYHFCFSIASPPNSLLLLLLMLLLMLLLLALLPSQ